MEKGPCFSPGSNIVVWLVAGEPMPTWITSRKKAQLWNMQENNNWRHLYPPRTLQTWNSQPGIYPFYKCQHDSPNNFYLTQVGVFCNPPIGWDVCRPWASTILGEFSNSCCWWTLHRFQTLIPLIVGAEMLINNVCLFGCLFGWLVASCVKTSIDIGWVTRGLETTCLLFQSPLVRIDQCSTPHPSLLIVIIDCHTTNYKYISLWLSSCMNWESHS